MNFLFVDRILSLNPGKQTSGLKQVTSADVYLGKNTQQQFFLFPCIVGEALGQLCSWNVVATSDYRFRPVGGVIQEINILDNAYLGETILLESEIETLDTENELVSFSGRASVKDKTLLIIKNSLAPLLPLQDFNEIQKVKSDFIHLNSAEIPTLKNNESIEPYPITQDKILLHEKGNKIIAEKMISPEALFFVDHFPKKPVFPLSLLLEHNLQLAHTFLQTEEFSTAKILHPTSVHKVKINNFVLPGDTLTTEITLKSQNEKGYTVNFLNTVKNKKVCVAEANFCFRELNS